MAKKVVLGVEEYTKVLSFVSDQKISVPGAIEAYKILLEASSVELMLVDKLPEEVHPEEIKGLTEQEITDSIIASAE